MSDTPIANKKDAVITPPELLQALQTVPMYEKTGNINQAVSLCQDLLTKYPEHPVVLHYLGILHLRTQQLPLAIDYLMKAVKKCPTQTLSFNYLGVAQCQSKDLDAGIVSYQKALQLEPKFQEAHYNLAIALVQKENFLEAEKHFREALKLNFVTAELHYNLGYLLYQRKEIKEAIEHYQAALKLNPNYIKCAVNLGEALIEANQLKEAKQIFEQLVKIYPEQHVFEKLALVYGSSGEHKLAIEYLEKINEKREDLFFLLAANYWGLKQYEKTSEAYKEGLKFFPKNLTFLLALIHSNRMSCFWEDHDELLKRLADCIDNDEYLYKYSSYYILGFSFEQELRFAKRIGSYFEQKAADYKAICNFSPRRPMNKKLRIGYLSANVKNHANAYTITNLFPNHDPDNFDAYLYSAGKSDNSAVAKELMETAPHFVDLFNRSIPDAAKQIYEDDIDLLVDFTGYFNNFSSSILALKPAKVQIGFMGHCGTRGANYIDYIFIDETVVKRSEAIHFYEKLIYLPDTFFICSDKLVPQEITLKELNIPEDKFILTCFNHAQKYEPRTFDAWMKVLDKVPNSILLLWLNNQNDYVKNNLLKEAKKYDMQDRLHFTGDISKAKHLGRLKHLHLFLDSFDCTAQSTAIDALSVGLPLVTLYGHNVASRGASSILKAIDLPELITYSIDEYIEKAVYYASHPEALQGLREKILRNKKTQPLFNSELLVKHLESAYVTVRDQYHNNIKENIFIS